MKSRLMTSVITYLRFNSYDGIVFNQIMIKIIFQGIRKEAPKKGVSS